MEAMYSDGHRSLQDAFGSRALADRLQDRLARDAFDNVDADHVDRCPFLVPATADADGRPDGSFNNGAPGFVRVVAPDLLVRS